MAARESLRRDSLNVDVKPVVKNESPDNHVKTEQVQREGASESRNGSSEETKPKKEEEPRGPSQAFIAAFHEMRGIQPSTSAPNRNGTLCV